MGGLDGPFDTGENKRVRDLVPNIFQSIHLLLLCGLIPLNSHEQASVETEQHHKKSKKIWLEILLPISIYWLQTLSQDPSHLELMVASTVKQG